MSDPTDQDLVPKKWLIQRAPNPAPTHWFQEYIKNVFFFASLHRYKSSVAVCWQDLLLIRLRTISILQ
jgi:hypothetical protein